MYFIYKTVSRLSSNYDIIDPVKFITCNVKRLMTINH